MLIDDYHKRINQQIHLVEESQKDACIEAGKRLAACVAGGGAVHVYDTGTLLIMSLFIGWRLAVPQAI